MFGKLFSDQEFYDVENRICLEFEMNDELITTTVRIEKCFRSLIIIKASEIYKKVCFKLKQIIIIHFRANHASF